jgi:phytoene dehydrogenase-like protein
MAADPAPLARDPYPARPVRRGLLRRGAPTLAEVAARELRDPRLAALLEHYAWAYGLDPRTAPASATVLPYMEQTFGTWYVRGGGLRALADAVHARCAARGVEFRFGAEVVRVLEKDGRAAGVELADGTLAEADAVVSGIAAGQPAGGLSRFTVLLALRGARSADAVHRTVVHRDEPVTVLRPDDPALRPDDGHEAVTLTVTVPPLGGPVDWADEAVAREYADRVVAAGGAAVPGLAERALWRVVRTPADIERETGAPGGVVTAPALAGAGGACLREPNRGALAGLYHVGGHAHPGGGPAHTGMSGAIVADLISGGPGGSR